MRASIATSTQLGNILEDKVDFNSPWMECLDPNLLVRYWRHKGRPGYLRTETKWGITVIRVSLPHGEWAFVEHPYLDGQ